MDRYQKQKKIGEGSFGKAYLVKSKDSGKQFVIKEINISKMGRKEREEAKKEVAVLAQMKHPNIVAYREHFEDVGNLVIVMDYCDGGDLYSVINKARGVLFPEEQVLDWFVQICLSIKHIHDRKILHRDIKSQNIFLTKAGIVKLGDFGIAKVLNSTVELARTCIGTPYYLSPEICENRPYNNKSDIWSLGCVLYELATLKHAFEAGNMKNLVLKIIRGSYPPVPPKYSYELRNLIAQLFKRTPRDRPSINSILKKPFIQKRIQKFLSETEMQAEFSHTIMHGAKVAKVLPPGKRPLGPAANRPISAPAVGKPPSAAGVPAARYNPAAKYGQPMARRAKENRKSDERRRPPSAGVRPPSGGARPPSGPSHAGVLAIANADLARKKQELMAKEKRRREEARNKQAGGIARQQRDLIEKQRLANIQKAKEEGWKNLVSSLGSENGGEDKNGKNGKPPSEGPSAAAPGRGNYEDYHAYLDKLEKDREEKNRDRPYSAGDQRAVPPARNAFQPMQGWPEKDAVKRQISPQDAARQGEVDRVLGTQAAERAKVVEEFLQRKREAQLNKNRGQAQLHGAPAATPLAGAAGALAQQRPDMAKRPISAVEGARNQEEAEYLSRLRQIRLQNFNERRNIKAAQKGAVPGDPRYDPEARKKKIEALKAQADARAQQLKEELERKRREAFDREKKKWQEPSRAAPAGGGGRAVPVGGGGRAVPVGVGGGGRAVPSDMGGGQRAVPIKAAPAPAMTHVMKAIGADVPQVPAAAAPAPGMTSVMQAIGAGAPKPAAAPAPGMTSVMQAIGASSTDDTERPQTAEQKKKEILKKLNDNPPEGSNDRPKWGQPVKPDIAVDRPKWGQGDAISGLKGMQLQDTASNMEATSAADLVIKNPSNIGGPLRKQWGGPAGTALNFLQDAKIQPDATVVIKSDQTDASVYSAKPGVTITIPKSQSKTEEEAEDKPKTDVTVVTCEPEDTKNKLAPTTDTKPKSPRPKSPRSSTSKTSSARKSKTRSSKEKKEKTEPDDESEKITDTKDSSNSSKDKSSLEVGDDTTSPKKEGSKTPRKESKSKKEDTTSPQEGGMSPQKSGSSLKKEDSLSPRKSSQKSPRKSVEKKEKLFDKVELEDETMMIKENVEDDITVEELEELEEELRKDYKISSAGVVIGLVTGHFDVPEAALLRTSSLPDLSKLFRTNLAENPFFNAGMVTGTSLQVELDEDEQLLDALGDEDEDIDESDEENDEDDEDNDENGEEDEGDDEDDMNEEDTEALLEMRETMETLLKDQEKQKGKSPRKPSPKKKPGIVSVTDSSQDEVETIKLDDVDGVVGTLDPAKEAWESDDDDDDDDVVHQADEDEDDMFCRLEESRLQLERELGCEKFMKAYKTVQACYEDEDDSIADGSKLVTHILGERKEHLYDKIVQLVMADGAYTEDND